MKKILTSYRFRIAAVCVLAPIVVASLLIIELVRRERVAERELRECGAFITGDLYGVQIPSDISDVQLTALLRRMEACRRPRGLDLNGCQINQEGFDVIARMTWLYRLSLRSTKVTDREIGKLEQLQQLHALNISETDVTDAGIRQLAKLRGLTTLNVFGSRVSSHGIEQLKTQLPKLHVIAPQKKRATQAETLL